MCKPSGVDCPDDRAVVKHARPAESKLNRRLGCGRRGQRRWRRGLRHGEGCETWLSVAADVERDVFAGSQHRLDGARCGLTYEQRAVLRQRVDVAVVPLHRGSRPLDRRPWVQAYEPERGTGVGSGGGTAAERREYVDGTGYGAARN